MSESRRQKRLSKASSRKPTSLSLTSLMDVFTILVFFLLVNSSSDAVIENPKDFKLPASISDINPGNTLELMIGVDEVLVQGSYVMSLADLQNDNSEDGVVSLISDELRRQFLLSSELFIGVPTEEDIKKLKELTVVANKEISYSEIKKVMASAADAGYTKFSMAVVQTSIDSN